MFVKYINKCSRNAGFFLQNWKRNSPMMRSTRITPISTQRENSTSRILASGLYTGHLYQLSGHFPSLSSLLAKVPYMPCHSAIHFCITRWPECKCIYYSVIKEGDIAQWKSFLNLDVTYILSSILFFIIGSTSLKGIPSYIFQPEVSHPCLLLKVLNH